MHHNQRSRKSGGLISDRLAPRPAKSQNQQSKPALKAKDKAVEAYKSPAVRRLERLIAGFSSSNQKSASGCFCQGTNSRAMIYNNYISLNIARNHTLSQYTPMCTTCGLIICELHPPHAPCPHCNSLLFSPSQRESVLLQLNEELARTLDTEERQRQALVEASRAAEGAFPALPTSQSTNTTSRSAGDGGTLKVLSLDPKLKRYTMKSYNTPSPSPSPAALSRSSSINEIHEQRVPPPPPEVPYFQGMPDHSDIWMDLLSVDPVTYVTIRKENGKGKVKTSS
jgi:hypothetical protein